MKAFFSALFLGASATTGVCSSYDELNAGIAARNLNNWDDAIAHFDSALAAGDLNSDLQFVSHFDRGEALAAKGHLDAAISDYTVCIELRPDDTTALLRRANAYFTSSNMDLARQDAQSAMAESPDDPEPYLIRSHVYEAQGDAQDALNDLQVVLAKNSADPSTDFEVGVIDFLMGRTEASQAVFTRLVNWSNHYPYIWIWLQMTALKQGKTVSQDFSAPFDRRTWPGALVDFFQGHTTEEAVKLAASQGDPLTQEGQICEANFYLGEWHLLRGDLMGGQKLMQMAAQGCPRALGVWRAAMAGLRNVP